MRKVRPITFVLAFFLINASILAVWTNTVRAGMVLNNSAEQSFNQTQMQQTIGETTGKSSITIYNAGGEPETIPIPFDKYGVSAFSHRNSSSILINDLKGGDKIDVQLRNYTLLLQEGYLQSDGRIRVIALTGEILPSKTCETRFLAEDELVAFSRTVQDFNGTITSICRALPYIAAEIPYEKIFAFSQCSFVNHLFLDRKYSVHLSESVPLIKPTEKWEKIENYFGFEINGTGVKIAVLDTGIDSTHPDLQNKVVAEQCFTDEGKTTDGFGHGTHCASIAAGTGAASNYAYVGVASGALLLNGKVLTDGGSGYESWIIQGIEWAVAQQAHVISMSFGADLNGDGTDPMSIVVDWATEQGAVCVVAAGNSGYGGMFTVGIPAVARKPITIGATTKTDYIADFSSQGPAADFRLKPDVCAPGVDIIAARAAGTSMGAPINDYYTMASGTSMATPHVAGAAALIRQAHPDWSPIMVKSALMGNAKVLTETNLWKQGAGRIQLCEATNTTLLITEPSASFGVLELDYSVNATFTIINTADSTQSVDLSTFTICEGVETDYVHLNASFLSILAHSSAYVLMTVGPIDLEAPEGWYEGWFSTAGNIDVCRAPYLFVSRTLIRASIYDVDNLTKVGGILVLANYPDMTLVDMSWFDPYYQAKPYTEFFAKAGNYSLCAQAGWIESASISDFSRAFMVQKLFSVEKFHATYINISLAEASVKEIPTVDEQNRSLTVHAYSQYFCGDRSPFGGTQMQWSTQYMWSGFDLNVPSLILYSTEYAPPAELSEAMGYYASNNLLTEVYLFTWKFHDTLTLPQKITQDYSKLAKYNFYYDLPETYPENGLHIHSAFWFTWDYIGVMQVWGWDINRIYAGIDANYYLTPMVAWYWGGYMPTYEGWTYPVFGPLQEYVIRGWEMPPLEKGTGSLILGRFDFGPYAPGLTIRTRRTDGRCIINVTGDLWAGLTWPSIWVEDFYPFLFPYYYLYVDGGLVAEGILARQDWWGVYWNDLLFSWEVTGSKALLQIYMPSLATISEQTVYNINFSLTEDFSILPFFTDLLMPLNYSPDENITILPKTPATVLFHITNISLSYSFDEGTTWHPAKALPTKAFTVPCQPSEKLAIWIEGTDNKGNRFQYYSNPVALCKKVNLNKTIVGLSIIIEASTLNNNPISDVALKIDSVNGSFYMPLDSMGRATLPTSISPIKAWFPKVGLYSKTLTPTPDVGILDIELSSVETYRGRIVDIYVTVKNYGEFSESFSVKTYYDNTLIGTVSVEELGSETNRTLAFSLNTTQLTPYVDYTIKAEASLTPYEINTVNNVLVDGNLKVRAVGDINGDKRIDMLDIVLAAGIYGCSQGQPEWNPFADVAREWGKIDILDLVTCASYYGEAYG